VPVPCVPLLLFMFMLFMLPVVSRMDPFVESRMDLPLVESRMDLPFVESRIEPPRRLRRELPFSEFDPVPDVPVVPEVELPDVLPDVPLELYEPLLLPP
jgi:hypothetical protein